MKRPNIRKEGYSIGQFLQIYKRVREQLEKREQAGHNLRVNLGNKIVEITPTYENENVEPGTVTGAIMASIAMWADEYVPIAADTEIVDSEGTEEGTKYTVNVDSPFPQQARFRALMEAGEGLPSILVDEMEVSEKEILEARTGRDTYQYEVVIKDTGGEGKETLGLGILDITQPPGQ